QSSPPLTAGVNPQVAKESPSTHAIGRDRPVRSRGRGSNDLIQHHHPAAEPAAGPRPDFEFQSVAMAHLRARRLSRQFDSSPEKGSPKAYAKGSPSAREPPPDNSSLRCHLTTTKLPKNNGRTMNALVRAADLCPLNRTEANFEPISPSICL